MGAIPLNVGLAIIEILTSALQPEVNPAVTG